MRIIKVKGKSLFPEYRDGDFVIISKIPIYLHRLRAGDTIVFKHAIYGRMIKIVDAVTSDGKVKVIGNHPDSLDSRQLGEIPSKSITGKVLIHIKKPA